jgi:hypothetical protein
VCPEDLLDALSGTGGDVRDLGTGGRGQGMELESTTRLVAHIHPIQREHMEVHIQSESAVRPLYCRDDPRVRVRNGAKPESDLRPAAQRSNGPRD